MGGGVRASRKQETYFKRIKESDVFFEITLA
jgi:hypothetical protein